MRLLLLSLRNLLGAGGVVLLLLCGVRLYPVLHRVLARGFRRFVTHDPKDKVHDDWRHPGRAFPNVNLKDLAPITPKGQKRSIAEAKTDGVTSGSEFVLDKIAAIRNRLDQQ